MYNYLFYKLLKKIEIDGKSIKNLNSLQNLYVSTLRRLKNGFSSTKKSINLLTRQLVYLSTKNELNYERQATNNDSKSDKRIVYAILLATCSHDYPVHVQLPQSSTVILQTGMPVHNISVHHSPSYTTHTHISQISGMATHSSANKG